MELGIYIHIPFCIQKCFYCDFVSFPNCFEKQSEYVEKVIEEIKQNKEKIENNNITTIYIGGGTPSSIESKYIKKILNEIYKIAKIKNTDDIEVTIEVNPGTITEEKLLDYKDSGINRLSIGLQSTDNNMLKNIGRIHSFEDFLNTYKLARKVKFNNINVDLMIGLPGMTTTDLKNNLEAVLKLNPEHISVYSLIVEEKTKIEKLISEGKLSLPTDEEERNQYKYTKNYLELNGYKHYEISNFAKPGFESKHNMNCWEQKSYLGFGVAAHSYYGGKRYSNTINLNDYINKDFNDIKQIHEVQTKEDMEKEFMMLNLRKIDGVQISKFKEKFGENPLYLYKKELDKLIHNKLLIVDLDNIKLTERGLDLANLVWEEFI